MAENTQKIYCNKCGKYLFTEQDTKTGIKRIDDQKNYCYDEAEDVFICNQCKK